MPHGAAFKQVLVEYDIDIDRRIVELVIRDAKTRRDYCVHLPAHVLPALRDTIVAIVEDAPDLFPDVKSLRVYG